MNFDIMNFLMDLKQTDFKTKIEMKIQEGVSKDNSKRRIIRERKDFVILSESELNEILNSQINVKKSLEAKEYLNNSEDLDFNDDFYDEISISFPILKDKQNEKDYGQINIFLIEDEYDFVIDITFNFFSLEEKMTTEDIKYFFNTTFVNLIKLFANNGVDKKALSYLNERVVSSFFKEDYIDFCLFDEYKESKKLDVIDFYIVSLMSNANEIKKNKDLLKELESDEHRELFDNSKEFIEEVISVTNPSNIKELVENLELRFGK
jgi:hypothetical protein